MFTGIIQERGRLVSLTPVGDAARIRVAAPAICADARQGDSVSVNGVCLTALPPADAPLGAGEFCADVMGETLARTTLGTLAPGDPLDLEAALRPSDRLGGHIVQGHVDATAAIRSLTPHAQWTVLRIDLPASIADLVAFKGSIAVDGVSLTVSAVGDGWFEVSLIPETLTQTVLGTRTAGDRVNLESDVLARHVRRLLQQGADLPARAEQKEH